MTRPTRWALTDDEHTEGFGERIAAMQAAGEDLEGEARLADALLPRAGRVVDVGSGSGRVGAALQARGHRVSAVEPDLALVARSRAAYPDLVVAACDVLDLEPEPVHDLVVCVGNVLVFLAEGTEVAVLTRLRELLAPGGRVLAGFEPVAARPGARDYPPEEFVADARAAGLVVQQRHGSYRLEPPADDYAVWVLTAG